MNDLWVEKKQELLKIFGNKHVIGLDDFIGNTQKDFEKNEWIDIGNKKIWIRRCLCGKIRLFRFLSTYKISKDLCYKCAMIKHNQSEKMRKISSESKIGNKNHFFGLKGKLNPTCKPENREKISKALKGRKVPWLKNNKYAVGNKLSKETRLIISKIHKGKCLSENHKNKIRIAQRRLFSKKIIERSKNGRINNIGKNELKYFTSLENDKKWNGIFYGKNDHQYFIEKLGYFVDYYEPNLNIIIEYDEPYHYDINENLKFKDQNRMNEIKNYLGCTFLRYNERTNVLKEY